MEENLIWRHRYTIYFCVIFALLKQLLSDFLLKLLEKCFMFYSTTRLQNFSTIMKIDKCEYMNPGGKNVSLDIGKILRCPNSKNI